MSNAAIPTLPLISPASLAKPLRVRSHPDCRAAGEPATVGNGSMFALRFDTQDEVRWESLIGLKRRARTTSEPLAF